jgi:hypothetical protein
MILVTVFSMGISTLHEKKKCYIAPLIATITCFYFDLPSKIIDHV